MKRTIHQRILCTGLLVMAASILAACGSKTEKKPGQALASVNGEEITVLQRNEELARTNVSAAQQETTKKQVLEALIDRQLLQGEAAKEKIDRDPKVVQAIERAKALIVAQAYMQKRVGTLARPSKDEVQAYYSQNPGFFANRKQFDMRELVLATADVNDQVKAAMDAAKSLDEVAAWLEERHVKFTRAAISRTSSDLPPELSGKLLAMPKGQMFIIREGERSLLVSIAEVKPAPVTVEVAAPQIEQFLFAKRNKEAAEAEIKRLRASAKITYLNQADAPVATAATTGVAEAVAPATDANERGVAGLK